VQRWSVAAIAIWVYGCGSEPRRSAAAAGAGDRATPTVERTPGVDCLAEGTGDTTSPFGHAAGAAPAMCCAGLTALDTYDAALMAAGRCILSKGGRFTCARCGDGRCGSGENWCNCARDCGDRPAKDG